MWYGDRNTPSLHKSVVVDVLVFKAFKADRCPANRLHINANATVSEVIVNAHPIITRRFNEVAIWVRGVDLHLESTSISK